MPTNPPLSHLRRALPLLVAGFVIEFFVIGGGVHTVSVFLNALTVANGWSHSSLSAGVAVGVLTAGLATPAVGILVDRFGVRVPMVVGAVLLGAGFAVLVTMTDAWQFVLANLLLGPGFAAAGMLPITIAITMRVPNGTALALGIVTTGSSVGALVLSPALQAVIDAWDWRTAYCASGLAVSLTPLVCLVALPRGRLRRAGADGAAAPAPLDLRRAFRRPGVLSFVGLLIVPGIVNFGLQVHLVPFLSSVGHVATVGAAALGAAIGVSAIGKLAGGFVGDRFGALGTFRLAIVAQVVAIAMLFGAGSPAALWVFVVLHGLAVGTEVAVTPVIALSVLGDDNFGTLYGILQLASTVAIAVAPIIPGVIFDSAGSYGIAIGFWMTTMALGAAIAFGMRDRGLASLPQEAASE